MTDTTTQVYDSKIGAYKGLKVAFYGFVGAILAGVIKTDPTQTAIITGAVLEFIVNWIKQNGHFYF